MSIARHHAEWLSLLDISGPFLSLPVLMRVFPQGLDAHDPDALRELRLAYEEWLEEKQKPHSDPAVHRAWVRFVLERTLELPKEYIAEGQAIPESLKLTVPQYGETLRPDLIVRSPLAGEGSRVRLLVHIFPPSQRLDKAPTASRYQDPITTRLMELLRATGAPLALATNGEEWMLVTSPEVSGGTTGYVWWYAALWLEEHLTLRAFRTLLGVRRFFSVPDNETLEALLKESAADQYELTDQLGSQVRHAVEVLVESIDRANQDRKGELLQGVSVEELYEAALTVMMRLIFLFAAEERRLFPLDDPFYAENYALSTLRAELREAGDQHGEEVLERRYDAWCRLLATFRAVYGGVQHERMNLMAYGGSLFDPDRFPFLEGRTKGTAWHDTPADPLPINNRNVLYILEALQILRVRLPGGGPAEPRRLSFRALDIEQIGDVYQTLLDHTAVRATEPVLGLGGTKNKEPELSLASLEAARARGEEPLLELLREETGRSANALRNALRDDEIQKALTDAHFASRLRAACGSDALFERVRPFVNLIRMDDFGDPVIILPGSVYVTAGMTRRQTQSHYTPRSLTEPLVQHTLEPLVYIGPAEGLPQAEWKLKSASELLQLKICDMAMGSASILVQVVRYLGDRLVEAWAEVERQQTADSRPEPSAVGRPSAVVPRITPEGKPATGALGEEMIPLDADERQLYARRIEADRCIYGVDKNPLAVELAKLSVWLVTLDKHRAFTFLDHALKCGDSLVGADEDMFLRWTHSNKSSAMPLFDEQLREQLEWARAKRRELEGFDVRDVRDVERKRALLAEANAALENIKMGCDIVVGARLLKLKDKEREQLLNHALLDFVTGKPLENELTRKAYNATRNVRAFHWFLEFPEVFERGGFSAFVGNPPFLGGLRISTMFGDEYLRYLREAYPSSTGTADLCAFFFLRAFEHLQRNGTFGLLATNTIAQGDTRETGLDKITRDGGTIYRALPSTPWPGAAAVYVGVLEIRKGIYDGEKFLDGKSVNHISSLLDSSITTQGKPYILNENARKSFIGSFTLGTGFMMEPEEARKLIKRNPKNADVLFPFLNGHDLNSRFDQSPSRWVINFFDWPLERAKEYPDCLEIIERLVKPHRDTVNRDRNRKRWWLYAENRPGLYGTIASLSRVLVIAQTSKTLAFTFSQTGIVFSHMTVVFAFDKYAQFSLLQSNIHIAWVLQYASSLKGDARYIPTDCFETFPFPEGIDCLETIGETYHEHRRHLMLARQEGLTTTYNRFHNPAEHSADIQRLRELHVEMDNAVAAAYGWNDLQLAHGFHETAQGIRFTLSEEARGEVLARLLRLNHERWEEEQKVASSQSSVDSKKKGKRKQKAEGKKRKAVKEGHERYQAGLFDLD